MIRKVSSKPVIITKEYGLKGGSIECFIPLNKIDDEQRMVYGVMTKASLDNQDEIVEWDATKEAVSDWMKWRNLREMHDEKTAAGTVPIIKFDEENKQVLVGAKVIDDDAWKKVKEGVYKGFSIGGKALSRVKEFSTELGRVISKVKKYVLNELSLVDRPAHPECAFIMIKRDGSFNDPLSSEVASAERKLEVFKKKICTDDVIHKMDDSKFGLVKKFRQRSGNTIIKKRYFFMPDRVHAQAVLNILPNSELTEKEQYQVHDKASSILGKRHKIEFCPYCQVLKTLKIIHSEEVKKMARISKSDIAKARHILRMARDEDPEAQEPGGDQVESEALRPAKQEKDFDPSMKDFHGEDAEGEYPEEDYEVSDEGEDEEGYDEPLEYEDEGAGVGPEEESTHLYDDASDYDEKSPPDSEDNESEEDEDEDEDEEGACPFCSTTMKLATKAAKSGDIRKSAIQCPGCGEIYDYGAQRHITVSQRVSKRSMRKQDGDLEKFVMELAKRDAVIEKQNNMIKELMGTMQKRDGDPSKPNIRKGRVNIEKIDDEETMKKRDETDLNKRKEEALYLRKLEREGQVLSPEQKAKIEKVLDDSIMAKVSK